MGYLSVEKRSRICTLFEEGYPSRYIASKENISQSTVIRIKQRKDKNGTFKNQPKPGRPRHLTGRNERNVLWLISSGKCTNAVSIQKKLKVEEQIEVSESTVKRTLRRNGLNSRIKRKKTYLRKMHRIARMKFAKKYRSWTAEDWNKVIWSDESKFMIYGSDGREYCWKKPNEPLRDHHVKPTVKFGWGNIMVWGCFTSDGVGNICRIYGHMNGDLYRQILKEDLLGTIEWHGMDKENIIFQQDNDPKHTAHLTKQWFEDNRVKVLDWPAQSPDLNPIEHLWNEMDRRLRRLETPVRTQDHLWDAIQKIWVELGSDVCKKLVDTMPTRINDVIRANGGYTRW